MNNTIIILFIILFQIGCSSAQNPNEGKQRVQVVKNDTVSYLFKNDTIVQIINIYYASDNLFYTYQVTNIKRSKYNHREGIAKKKKNINMELGEDEEGNAYPVDVYENKNGTCWFIISVEEDKKSMVTIMETKECLNRINYTSINSVGILRKN